MADFEFKPEDIKRRMDGAVDSLHQEFGGLRTGRASASLLEPIMVEAYGSKMPMNQVGNINVPDPRTLSVNVWDQSLVSSVEKAIRESDLGLNPATEGQTIRVPVPTLTEERRKDMVKVAAKYAEDARVAVRNVRRHAMDELKKAQKDGDISEDEHRDFSDQVQKMTDDTIAKIDQALEKKEKDIMQV